MWKNGNLHTVTSDPTAFLSTLKYRDYGVGSGRGLVLEAQSSTFGDGNWATRAERRQTSE